MTISLIDIFDFFYNLAFDLYYNIKTTINTPVHQMLVSSKNLKYGKMYQATNYRLLKKIFKNLDIDYQNYNFIDIGAGKGRALILAFNLGFQKIIGVEYAKDLCQMCQSNINNCLTNKEDLSKIEILNQDAVNFSPPKGPNLYLLYNPFDGNILKYFLNNLERSKNFSSHDLFVYINPLRDYIFFMKGFELIRKMDHFNHNRIVKIFRKSKDQNY